MMGIWAGSVVGLLGCSILLLILLDILVTTLHPTAQSILSARVNRSVWFLVCAMSRIVGSPWGRNLLNWTIPIAVAGLLLFWLLGLLLGFALLYAPFMEVRGAFGSPTSALHWGDAFYFSGSCLTSIGFGDIVPQSGVLRTIAVCEGLSGLLVVGISISYVLTIFPVLPQVRVLALTINEETNGQVDAVPMVRRYLEVAAGEALAQRCRELATQLIVQSEAHNEHPILFYAHPRRVEQSFLRVLVVTQGLIALLRYGVRQTDYPTLVRDPRVVGLEESFIAILRQLGASLHLQVLQGHSIETERTLDEDFGRFTVKLQEANLRHGPAPSWHERSAYIRFRLVTDATIHAYWANTGYTADELWGDYPPLRGSTAPLYSASDTEKLGEERNVSKSLAGAPQADKVGESARDQSEVALIH